jgi:glycosyltransferase involved in cell wall biosynthesis
MYDIPEEVIEYYPLGGIHINERDREKKRNKIRKELNLKNDDLLLVHSGKMSKFKKTEEILEAFLNVPNENLHLILIGSLCEDIKQNVKNIMSQEPRIRYVGWKNGDEMIDYLCASDLYVQPGTQSVTMQNALCSGSAAALYPYPSHKNLLNDSVFYIQSVEDMIELFNFISKFSDELEEKRIAASKIAKDVLDYKVLASRLYIS